MPELIDIAILQLVTAIRNGQYLSCNVVKQFKKQNPIGNRNKPDRIFSLLHCFDKGLFAERLRMIEFYGIIIKNWQYESKNTY